MRMLEERRKLLKDGEVDSDQIDEFLAHYKKGKYMQCKWNEITKKFESSDEALKQALAMKYSGFMPRRKYNVQCKTLSSVFDPNKAVWLPRNFSDDGTQEATDTLCLLETLTREVSEVVRSYDVILTSATLPEYQGECRYYRSGRKLTRIVASLWIIKDNVVGQLRSPEVSEVTVTSRNFRQLRTTSDTCHPTPQVSEVTVTSRNFGQLQTPATLPHKYTCHPTPQVSEVTVTSRNFRQLRTTSDTCHPTPQVSEVTVTSDFTPDNPQNHSEMVVTSDNFRQLLPP
ncbi:hypothetical protein Bbelb_082540 [Branchiostoma belcheri]|nr:hypothetical protein Bbelb_082540 [Branchiostoma belcheri]